METARDSVITRSSPKRAQVVTSTEHVSAEEIGDTDARVIHTSAAADIGD